MAASTGQASVSYAGVHPLQSLWGRRDEEAEMNQVLIDVAIVTGASSGLGVGMGGSVVGGLVTASDMNVVDQSSSLPGECGRFCGWRIRSFNRTRRQLLHDARGGRRRAGRTQTRHRYERRTRRRPLSSIRRPRRVSVAFLAAIENSESSMSSSMGSIWAVALWWYGARRASAKQRC
jgi:hypothetical protein